MYFELGEVYHIYNQGNNRQRIFFNKGNYIFFLRKIKENVLPFADILAWCLMPNHFHLIVYVKQVEINVEVGSTDRVTLSHPVRNVRTFNDSIAIMLRSYTRAINKQENRSGALFRQSTQAECITKPYGITPSFYDLQSGTIINTHDPEKEYPQICFNYIHQNPVKAKLVQHAEEWEFSSYRDYIGIREGKLINKNKAKEFLCF